MCNKVHPIYEVSVPIKAATAMAFSICKNGSASWFVDCVAFQSVQFSIAEHQIGLKIQTFHLDYAHFSEWFCLIQTRADIVGKQSFRYIRCVSLSISGFLMTLCLCTLVNIGIK